MRKSGVLIAIVVAAVLGGCSAEAPAPKAETASTEAATPQAARLPIGEITREDEPALLAASYPEGVPATVKALGTFIIGERVGLLTGADNADTCATCAGSVSLFYLARTDAGFMRQADYPNFYKSGSGGKLNRDLAVSKLGGVDGGPSFAGFSDVNSEVKGACTAKTITVVIFTEAGPRTALTAPFGIDKGGDSIKSMVIGSADYQADFAISYRYPQDDFVTPYLFVGQSLRPSYPAPEWTQRKC